MCCKGMDGLDVVCKGICKGVRDCVREYMIGYDWFCLLYKWD